GSSRLASSAESNTGIVKKSCWSNGPRLPWNPPVLGVPCGGPAGPTRLIWCGRATPVWLVDPPLRAAGLCWCCVLRCCVLLLLLRNEPGLRDDREHAADDLVDAKPGGIHGDRVSGRPQRRHGAIGIARITGEDLP